MNWDKVVKVPKYNPWTFELIRHLDMLSKSEFARKAKIPYDVYSAIENGEIEPSEDDFEKIFKAQSHVLKEFYEQWPETEVDISSGLGISKPINYYKYKIFRELNPPSMRVV